MQKLSDILERGQEKILEVWEARARREIFLCKRQPHPALLNALPLFLDEIVRILSEGPRPYAYAAESISKQHGRQRADMKAYTLKHVLFEYALLRRVIFEVLEETRPLAPDERDLLYDVIVHGMLDAGEEFARLKASGERAALAQAEAARILAENASRAKDVFLAVMSHELRAPLTPLLGYARMLQAGMLNPAETAEAFKVIEKSVRQETQIVDDLLDASRLMRGKLSLELRPMDLVAATESAIGVIRPAAILKDLHLKANYPAESISIFGDAARLQQVFVNLLNNAVKFTPEGGRVTISVLVNGSHVRVAVADTGEGVAPEVLPMLFQQFWQADSSSQRLHGGMGLGLSISRHLVEMHGGTLSCESAGPGLGSTFMIILPLAKLEGRAKEQAVPPRQIERTLLAGLSVLVVDDEKDTLQMLGTVLRQFGARAVTASSVREAFELLRREKPDVVLADIAMPGENGFSLIKKVRALPEAQGGAIPMLALTGYAGEKDRLAILSAGFLHCLVKPIEPEYLVVTINGLRGKLKAAAAV
jgi:signal transduction histidine kinase/ActR/RegA family two-component response regulator